ncbi:MAG: sensor histidine kinase [Thermodesulfobacteriota bacterium]
MAFSIRTKLTFWYVTLLTVSLIAFGGLFSYSLFKIFMNRIDNQISSVANMMVHTVIKPSGQMFLPKDFDLILGRFFGIRTAGNYIQVLDLHGKVVARSSNLDTFKLPIPRETYMAALLNGATSFEIVRSVGRYPVRMVTKPIILKDRGLVAIVQVGTSLESVQEVFHAFIYIFISGILAAIIVAGAVGWFLAQKALKPVSEITKLARRIGAENLSERLNIAVPQDEIGMLASTINGMFERLENSFKQIKQFTGDASHELKTPLTILKGEMEIALRSKGNVEHMKEALESGLEEIDRMSNIVNNLLDLAKMDVEREALPREPVSLDKVFIERYEHFRGRAADKGIELVMGRCAPAVVTGDTVRLSQLFFNLIDNAIKYTPGGGRVDLSLDVDGHDAIVKVKDTGLGVSEQDIPYLFDRFYRANKARSGDEGGAGLGLSICKEIAVAHGGSISVESAPGQGSTFITRLPLA